MGGGNWIIQRKRIGRKYIVYIASNALYDVGPFKKTFKVMVQDVWRKPAGIAIGRTKTVYVTGLLSNAKKVYNSIKTVRQVEYKL